MTAPATTIDVNISLERWPFRRTTCDELPALLERLIRHGVRQAWAGSLDGVLHRDVGGVNLRLAAACRKARGVELLAFGTVNPMLPDWQEDLRRCHEDFHMPGVRLHPNYHGYKLDAPELAELLDAAAARGLLVQLAGRMDDVRVQYPLMQVPDVDLAPLAAVVQARPKLRLVVLNAFGGAAKPAVVAALAATGRVWFDIATQEGVAGVAGLAKAVSPQRVLFGSHLPLFALESAVLKIKEAGFDEKTRGLVEHANAVELLSRRSE